MDLLATVRKEGSRGGTGDFKWSDVQNSSHREHYLGHSLHAPVGRWAKGRDLNWYARSNEEESASAADASQKASDERAAEIRRVKEAEQDAMARALGLPVPDRSNANTEPLGNRKEVDRVLGEAADGGVGGSGIGYGTLSKASYDGSAKIERIEGDADHQDKELQSALKEYHRRHGEGSKRRRSRSRSQDRHRRRRDSRNRHRSIRSDLRDGGKKSRRRPSPMKRHESIGRDRSGQLRDDRQHHGRQRSRSPKRRYDRRDLQDERTG